MSTVLATYNIKGGVGKTSAAVNLAALAAADGLRTLLWDLDPQGSATFLFRVKPKVRGGVAKLVRGRSDVGARLKGTDVEGLDLLPADFSYRHMDLVLDDTKRPTRRLARVLQAVGDAPGRRIAMLRLHLDRAGDPDHHARRHRRPEARAFRFLQGRASRHAVARRRGMDRGDRVAIIRRPAAHSATSACAW